MRISKRKYLLYFISMVIMISVVGCVNYEKIVQEKETESILEQNLKPVSLADINGDGKEERLAVEITSTEEVLLKVYSGKKVEGKFELDKEYDYLSLKAYVANIDEDDKNEIIALIKSSERDVNVVKIINEQDNGKYELYDFPEKVVSNESYSGFNVTVKAGEEFVYYIEKDDFKVEVDASRLYTLSMRNKEDYEKIKEVWDKMLASDFHGESLGVEDIYILNKANGDVVLDVYECIVGGDDKIIGYLVTEMKYNSDGTYLVEQVEFKERVDVMP